MRVYTPINKNIKDKTVVYAVVLCLILTFAHGLQFFRSELLTPLIYSISSFTAVILLLFCGKNIMPYYLFVVAVLYLFLIRFTDCSSFLVILACCFFKPKLKKTYILLYFSAMIVYMTLSNFAISHALIHFARCSLWYLVDSLLSSYIKTLRPVQAPLNLTDDEKLILDLLAEGYEVKEIKEFCENTVYSKLKDARIRNGISRNSQLVERYRETTLIKEPVNQ